MILTCWHASETCRKRNREKQNAVRQGIISNEDCNPNCIKLRINAKDKNT